MLIHKLTHKNRFSLIQGGNMKTHLKVTAPWSSMCRILGAFFSWSTFWYLCNLRGYRQSQVLHCKMRGTLASEVFHATTLCLSRASEILIKYFKPRKRKWLAPSALYHFARSVVQDHLAYKMDCVCDICLKLYTNNEKLGLHQKKRHSHERLVKGKSQNICKPCGKSFDRKANFDSNVKVHLKQSAEQFNYT